MKVDRFLRIVIAVAILVVFIVATGGLLFVTDSALRVWDRLAAGPAVFLYLYIAALAAIVLGAIYLIWRLVIRRPIESSKPADACSAL